MLLSGLPGAGKDTWIEQHLSHWPQISLDAIRRELRLPPTKKQGQVVQRAREMARIHLRAAEPFVWNATQLSRDQRRQCLDLFHDYRARIRIVYVEASRDLLRQQNRAREDAVPETVIERLLDRWEVPDPFEAHRVDYVVQSSDSSALRTPGRE